MSHTYIQVQAIPHVEVPRGARLVGLLVSALRLLFAPAAVRPLSRAEEAVAVRRLARELESTDPSFAAELRAAAARHESLDDEAPRRSR